MHACQPKFVVPVSGTQLCLLMTLIREKEKHQLTIFYNGKVLVFDNFPAEKANDLMQMAGKGASVSQNSGLLPSPAVAAVNVTDSTKVAAVPAAPIPLVSAQKYAAGDWSTSFSYVFDI